MSDLLKNKVAVVTGGTKGIGFAIAELSKHGNAGGEICDVRSEEQVRQMLDECERQYGGVDILVNNAGTVVFGKTIEELSGDEFRLVLETNLFGVFYACHHSIPMMKRRGGGYIINISSLAGQNAIPKLASYNASKFGLNGFSEAMMQEVRQDNIKVSYICPGSVNTHFGNETPSAEKAWQIQPEDIAEVVINLLAMNPRTLPSKVEIRPSKPPGK